MYSCQKIKKEMDNHEKDKSIKSYLRYLGYRDHFDDPITIAKAYAIESLFTGSKKHIYKNDLIAGSLSGLYSKVINDADISQAEEISRIYEHNSFLNNFDHFAGSYSTFLADGIGGTVNKIDASIKKYTQDEKKQIFLLSAKISMQALSKMSLQYAEVADSSGQTEIAATCRNITTNPPKTFREALQLIWLVFQAFWCEGRHAMALGRIDQYLYPYYKTDINNSIITHDFAIELLSSAFIKIGELNHFESCVDVVNICIGGVDINGNDATNELSIAVLEAVKRANIPGPNLSARIHKNTPKGFILSCLDVIGTGLGYPAMMNDEVNIPALLKVGYKLEHARDYCMVGCIENFIGGMQPPWSDGRFNAPKYLEILLNNGRCMLTSKPLGLEVNLDNITTMQEFVAEFRKQLIFASQEYMVRFRVNNRLLNTEFIEQPFLSCFCYDCIGRGLDINDGGAYYPSVHGAACMGISTVADSLAAIDKLVFTQKKYTLKQISYILKNDFKSFEATQADMIAVPKYGNNNDLPDKYAVWYIETMHEIFDKYRTYDGGHIYIAVAANTQNISAGEVTAATPDGRKSKKPLNDAASPTYGMDKNGPTAVILSCTKPDYTKAACGTVLNQKFSQGFFTDPNKREKLYSLVRTYFDMGGQEMQINAISRKVLEDAMENPDGYKNLVVRVSGFSAYYTALEKAVQEDILSRTEHV